MANPEKTIAQRLDEFNKRHQPAVARRERLLALREAEQNRLDELKRQALAQFGTSDLEALRRQFAETEARRSQLLFEAETELAAAEEALSVVERRISLPSSS